MSHRSYRTGLMIAYALCGCASGATEPTTPVDAPIARNEAPPAGESATIAEGPVEKPQDLGLSFRFSSPARDLPIVSQLVPMDPDAKAMFGNPSGFLGVVFGPALAGMVDLTRPADVLAASWPKDQPGPTRIAFALTLDPDAAPTDELRRVFALHRRAGGGIALEPRSAGRSVGVVGSKLACELWPSRSRDVRGCLVCAAEAETLPAYAPYLARGMMMMPTPAATPANMRLEFEGSLLRGLAPTEDSPSRFTGQVPEDDTEKLGRQIALDFINDWDTMALEVSLNLGRIELTYEQAFRSDQSTATVFACAHPAAPTPPPPALFRMPADADIALYFQGAPKEAMKTRGPAAWRRFLETLPEKLLPRSMHDELIGTLGSLLLMGGPLVVAYGQDRQSALAALDTYVLTRPPPGDAKLAVDADLQKARHAMQGWTLVYLDEPFDVWRKGVRDMLRLNNKAFAPEVRKAGASGQGGAEARLPAPWLREQPVSPSDTLPSGSLHFVMKLARTGSKAPQGKSLDEALKIPHELHLWLAPEGGSTWLAWGEDPRLARDKLRQVLGSGAAAPTRAPLGLDALRGKPSAGMGAVTLAGLVSTVLADASRADIMNAGRRLAHLDALPAKGQSPIPFLWRSELRADKDRSQGCRLQLSTSLDQGALKSLISWGKAYGSTGRAERRR
jgi:hypothetical protein